MPRTEQIMMDGWEFTLGGSREGPYQPVYLPHDWGVETPFEHSGGNASQGFHNRWGIGWYRKILTVQEMKKGYQYYLDFGGINENSTVWVNGKAAGGRKYGYSPFQVEVTSLIHTGENLIEVCADNTAKPADRWYSGAGIYRTVKWIEAEEGHLDPNEIIINTKVMGLDAEIEIDTGTEGSVKAFLSDGNVNIKAEGLHGKLFLSVPDARLWSAEDPHLYTLSVQKWDNSRLADEITLRIGIREVSFLPGKGMFVNGKPEKLKGVCLHQDVGCRGVAAKKEIWRERLLLLKEMGCNAIRPAHHMFSEEFLDLCDELGFYVYEECFDKWTGGLYGRYFQTEWQKDLSCMIKRDRNRPSIIIWGVGNEVENQAQESMLQILRMLVVCAKSLDSSRPVTYAMNPHFKRESRLDVSKVKDIQKFVDEADDTEIYDLSERIQRINRIAGIVDIISCNYQEQWYEQIHQANPDKLILGTEIYQYFHGHENQMQNFTDKNPSLEPVKADYVIGGMIWTGIDYLGESMGYPAKGWGGALIRTNCEKKPGFYLLKSYWSQEPTVHFSVLDYSLPDEGVKEHWDIPPYADHWCFPQFQRIVIPYMIATNCDEVRLYLNGKQFYVPKPEDCPNHMITGFLPWQSGTVEAIGCQNGKEACRSVIRTPGPAVKLVFDQGEKKAPGESGYEMLLTVRAKDREDTPCFRESALVQFRIQGDGEIIGVDSGCLMSNEPYRETSVHMVHGCASVQIRLNGTKGRVAVFADAEGMFSGQAVILAQ